MMNSKTTHLPEPLCVRIPVAAAMLGIGRTKLYELIDNGELETIKLGKSRLILTKSIHELVVRNCFPQS